MRRTRLLAIGEALIDFLPSGGPGFPESFSPAVGGAPANVCAAYAGLGGEAAMLTRLGDDMFGQRIVSVLSGLGVDVSHIGFTSAAGTALAFVSLGAHGQRAFSFYRGPSADMLYTPEELPAELFSDAFGLHFCSVALTPSPMRDAHRRAVGLARSSGALVSFDVNLRLPLWPDRDALRAAVAEYMPLSDIIKLSDDELEFLTGSADPDAARPLLKGETKLVLVTCGAKGAHAFTKSRSAFAAAPSVSPVDTTGAGDAFMGAFLKKLCDVGASPTGLEGAGLQRALEFACVYAAATVAGRGAIPSYPGLAEFTAATGLD